MWCGDVVLVGNKVGTVTGVHSDGCTLAMCDGTTAVYAIGDITAVVSTALQTARDFEAAICKGAQ